MEQRWESIKNLIDSKLETKKSYAICLNLSVHTEDRLKEYFKLTFKPGSVIIFKKKGVE